MRINKPLWLEGPIPFQRRDEDALRASRLDIEQTRLSPSASIRALLHDTALCVASLEQGGKRKTVEALRADCARQIQAFSDALEQRRIPVDIRHDAIWAQCGLLDEVALRQLSTQHERAQWETQPLQVERFGRHDAGTYVFERIAARLRETSPDADLLEIYAAVLGLGFKGRYAAQSTLASDGRGARDADTLDDVRAALNAELERLGRGRHRAFVSDHGERRIGDWLYRLSPWAIALAGVALAAIVFAVWNGLLAAQLSRLLPAQS